jgi:hypothetical protein
LTAENDFFVDSELNLVFLNSNGLFFEVTQSETLDLAGGRFGQLAGEESGCVKQGKDALFGFRDLSLVDTEDGCVEHVEVHPAKQE